MVQSEGIFFHIKKKILLFSKFFVTYFDMSIKMIDEMQHAVESMTDSDNATEINGIIQNESRYIVARNVKAYRKKLGLTQAQLAQEINKTVEMICQLENNGSSTKLSTLDAIADAFGIETYMLFLRDDKPNLENFSSELLDLMVELEEQTPEFIKTLTDLLKFHK